MEEKRISGRWLTWLVIGLVFLTVVYVLSMGPALRLVNQAGLSELDGIGYAVIVFYLPLFELAECEWLPFGPWLVDYVEFWAE